MKQKTGSSPVEEAGPREMAWAYFERPEPRSPNRGDAPVAHTIYFSDRPERIVGHLTTHRFLQWWSDGDDSFAVDPPNAVLAWGEPGNDTPAEAIVVISDPAVTADGLQYHIQTLQGTLPVKAGPCVLFIDPLGRPLSPVSVAGVRRRDMRRERRRL